MSELNYASTLAALDDEFASASASTGSGSVPVGRYNAMIKEAKIVARTGGGLALSVSFVVTEGEYKGRYAFTSYGLHKNGLPYFKGFLQTIQLPLERLSELEQILPRSRPPLRHQCADRQTEPPVHPHLCRQISGHGRHPRGAGRIRSRQPTRTALPPPTMTATMPF